MHASVNNYLHPFFDIRIRNVKLISQLSQNKSIPSKLYVNLIGGGRNVQ